MKIYHVIPGLKDVTCGIAVAANMIARRQKKKGNEIQCADSRSWKWRDIRSADEVWVHSMWTLGVLMATIAAIILRRRLVRMPHGCLDPVKLAHHWHKKRFVSPVEKRLFRRSDVIIATDVAESDWIHRWLPDYKGQVRLLSLVGDSDFNGAAQTNRVSENGLNVLYVGRLTELKGVKYLLEALPDEAKLVMIGKDEGELPVCRKIAIERGLDVDFRGVVSEEEKEVAYAWCDVLVLPTLSENFGLVVAEALERGKRVVTTDGAPAWGDGSDYGGRLVYLRGFREGTGEERVRLLKEALNGEPPIYPDRAH